MIGLQSRRKNCLRIYLLLLAFGFSLFVTAQESANGYAYMSAMDSAFIEATSQRNDQNWDDYENTLKYISSMPYDVDGANAFINFVRRESDVLSKISPIKSAYIWNYVARLYARNGFREKSIKFYEKAVEGLRDYNDTLYLPRMYFYLSQSVMMARGDGTKAMEYAIEAERIYKTKSEQDSSFMGRLSYIKGYATRSTDEELAIPFFKKAQELTGDEYGRYQAFITRSLIYLERFDEALQSAKILSSKRMAYSGQIDAECQEMLGRAWSGLGKHKKGLSLIEEAIKLGEETYGTTSENYIKLFYFLARIQEQMGAYDGALINCQKVFQLSIPGYKNKSLFDTPDMRAIHPNIWVLEALMLKGHLLQKLHSKTGDLDMLRASIQNAEQNIINIERRRDLLPLWKSQKQFNDFILNAYDNALVSAAHLYQNESSEKNRAILFSFLERSKATLLQGSKRQSDQLEKMSPELKEKQETLQQQIADAETALLEKKGNLEGVDLTMLRKNVFDLHTEWEELIKKHMNTFTERLNTITLEDIQTSLNIQSAIVAYCVTAEHILILTIERDDFGVQIISKDGSLDRNYRKMHEGLSNWGAVLGSPQKSLLLFKQHADTLSELLLRPILDLSPEVDNLVILADGLIHGIPFEALPLPEHDHFLLKDYNISYAYTLSTLQTEDGALKNDIRSFGGYAPSYELDKKLFAEASNEISTDQLLALRSGLMDIPEARANLIDLADQFDGMAWTENEATKTHFMSNARAYDLLHLGMHGQLDTNSSFLSHLVFYGKEKNRLYLREIQAMNIPSELVVLSACNTGVGTHINGEGPLSLARAFFYAGAKSTLMSLWQVPDQQTAKIMRLFYDNIDKGFSKSKALTEAKRTYLQNASKLEAHPAFWSGFVLVGDTAPLRIITGLNIWYLIGLAFLFAFVAGYWYYSRDKII